MISINRNKDWKDSLSLWTKTLEVEPNSFRAHGNLARVYQEKGLIEASLREVKKTMALNPRDYKAYYNLAQAFSTRGWDEEMMLALKRAISIKPDYDVAVNRLIEANLSLMRSYPDDYKPYMNLGDGLRIAGRYSEAIKYLETAHNMVPENLDVLYFLGECNRGAGNYDRAIEYYEKVIAESPKDYRSHLGLAETYRARGDNDNAEKYYLMLPGLKADDAEPLITVAKFYMEKDEVSKALRYYEKAVDLNPADYLLYAVTAIVYAKENKKLKRALELADQSLVLKVENGPAFKAKGYIYFKMKDYENAKKYLIAARQKLPDDAEIRGLIAEIMEKTD
jgi:tetratricopeptide (TPR) repeat protein